jgi:hypothetical protein
VTGSAACARRGIARLSCIARVTSTPRSASKARFTPTAAAAASTVSTVPAASRRSRRRPSGSSRRRCFIAHP